MTDNHKIEVTQESIDYFMERMKKRQEAEDEKAKLEAEKDRLAYLKRTGRTEYKP